MLFKSIFNINGENIILYTRASSIELAFNNFIFQLVKKTKLNKYLLLNMFNGNKDNYYIQKEEIWNYPRSK